MTFGSAETADGVAEYMRSVRGGEPSADVVTEFERRYRLVGRSPLLDITGAQAAGLQAWLDDKYGAGAYRTAVGMLHSEPRISGSVAQLAKECDTVIGIIMAPQYSPQIMSGYPTAFDDALAAARVTGRIADAWYEFESFHATLAQRVKEALERHGSEIPVVFTAHSLPKRVVARDPDYIEALKETAGSIADRCRLASAQWQFAYQSAGHSPEEWLRPDFKELLPGLKAAGHDEVLVVPTQFVADHLEVLYDIDIAGQEEAKSLGMTMYRTEMPNTSPAFIKTLGDVVGIALRQAAEAV